jgi:hypothetical protein
LADRFTSELMHFNASGLCCGTRFERKERAGQKYSTRSGIVVYNTYSRAFMMSSNSPKLNLDNNQLTPFIESQPVNPYKKFQEL